VATDVEAFQRHTEPILKCLEELAGVIAVDTEVAEKGRLRSERIRRDPALMRDEISHLAPVVLFALHASCPFRVV
jgi:hypothetical protein